MQAYNFAKRLKRLKGLTPYEFICAEWRKNPVLFHRDPADLTPGPYKRALEKIRDLDDTLAVHQDEPLVARKYSKGKPLARLLADFHTYVE